MLLLILGLPFAMAFAWYHGARASRQISRAGARRRTLDAVCPVVNLSSDKEQKTLIVEGQLRVQLDSAVNVLATAGGTR